MNSDKQVKVNGSASISYHAFVEKLVKKFGPKDGTVETLRSKIEYCHSAIGLVTEAGEVADVLKAHAIYGKPLDREALVKELGDLRFWMQDIQNKFHVSDHEIAQGNADKLSERYAKMHYSDAQAIARVDKKWVVALGTQEMFEGLYIERFEHEYEAIAHAVNIGGVFKKIGG